MKKASSGFDALKDLLIEDFGFVEGTNIRVSVKSYDKGEAKLDMKREFQRKNGETGFSPLGRLTLHEAILLGAFLTEKISSAESPSDESDKVK